MTIEEIIQTRQRYYLEIQVERLLQLESLNEHQWHALHFMQFCIHASDVTDVTYPESS